MQEAEGIEENADTTAHDWMGASALEMPADILLELNRSAQALQQYQAALKLTPNRFDALAGAALRASKNKPELAQGYYEKLVENCPGSVSSRRELQEARDFLRNINVKRS